MSANAKNKNKTKNNETPLAEAVAIASAPEPAAAAPEVAAAVAAETAPPVVDTDAVEAPAAETPPRPALLLRARLVAGKTVVTIFAGVRNAQATAVKKSLAWITAADAGLAKSLLAGEQFVLTRLRVTPE